jgi:hypothetical protein
LASVRESFLYVSGQLEFDEIQEIRNLRNSGIRGNLNSGISVGDDLREKALRIWEETKSKTSLRKSRLEV